MSVALVVAYTFAPPVQGPTVLTALVKFMTSILGTNPGVEYQTISTSGFSIHEPPLSPFPIKRTQGDNSLTPVEESSSRRLTFRRVSGNRLSPISFSFQLFF